MAVWVGIDVGGTFTDFIGQDDQTGRSFEYKFASMPSDPTEAMIIGLRELMAKLDVSPESIAQIAHGTTVATNALIQRTGAQVALVTTKGFRDVLEIGRQQRPKHFNMHLDFPPSVVPRAHRLEVEERVTADGTVRVPLQDAEIDRIVERLRQLDIEAIAISLLFSHLAPLHEQKIFHAISINLPDKFVSLSSEVQPEIREYERTSTTAQNAYLQPLVDRYLSKLSARVSEEFPNADLVISQSSGGLMSINQAIRFPIRTALSGPAAGVLGAVEVARKTECPHVITFDMGGTSADVAMIRDYSPAQSYEKLVGGLPVRLPSVDISTIGAGGGSIARIDRVGRLKVGPLSAGAEPGPACYGQGGRDATVTDANLILGRLSPAGLLGGKMPLDIDAAEEAIDRIAKPLGLSEVQAASGILEIVSSNMARIVRAISVDRGYDPRQLSLVAYGGAGPLHASDLAASLDMHQVIVPASPGILCAAGLNASDLREDFVQTVRIDLSADQAADPLVALNDDLTNLHAAAFAWFDAERIHRERRYISTALDMHYVGQNFELVVPLFNGGGDDQPKLPTPKDLLQTFFEIHERTYGFFSATDPVRIINCRLSAGGRRQHREDNLPLPDIGVAADPIDNRTVWFNSGEGVQTRIYSRDQMCQGQKVQGPAIVEQMDSTTLVFPGDTLRVDEHLNMIMEFTR